MTKTDTNPLNGEYPLTWRAFIGQEGAKEQLITAARSAKKRKVRMPHVLLEDGRPGVGKTALALLCAKEMGTSARVVAGQVTTQDARLLFAEMNDGDVLIIDEFHQMVAGGKAKAEWLLHYLENGCIVGPFGPEEQPSITIIAATTDAGRIQPTILGRFKCRPALVPYTEAEATKIAQGKARHIFPAELAQPSARTCREVAHAASFNPRTMGAILETVRDIALVHSERNRTGATYDISQALEWMGLTADGLTNTAQRFLLALITDFAGKEAGKAALQDRLQEPGGLAETERLLMDKGLIAKSKAGRVLTQEGIRRARQLLADAEAAAAA